MVAGVSVRQFAVCQSKSRQSAQSIVTELFDGNEGDAQILKLRTFPGACGELEDVKFVCTDRSHDRPIRTVETMTACENTGSPGLPNTGQIS